MAAQSGAIILRAAGGGSKYINIYADDSAGDKIRFDDGAGAGAATSTEFRPPFGGIISDFILAAASGQTKTQINVNNVPVGTVLLNSIHLASVENRPPVGVPFSAGSKIELIQLA